MSGVLTPPPKSEKPQRPLLGALKKSGTSMSNLNAVQGGNSPSRSDESTTGTDMDGSPQKAPYSAPLPPLTACPVEMFELPSLPGPAIPLELGLSAQSMADRRHPRLDLPPDADDLTLASPIPIADKPDGQLGKGLPPRHRYASSSLACSVPSTGSGAATTECNSAEVRSDDGSTGARSRSSSVDALAVSPLRPALTSPNQRASISLFSPRSGSRIGSSLSSPTLSPQGANFTNLTKRIQRSSTFSGSGTPSSFMDIEIDVLPLMKEGAPFLKYCTRGYPHFRLFFLTEDNTAIAWYSKGKRLTETLIPIANIDEIVVGQTTANFLRYPAPNLTRTSFSLVYDNRKKTLDLVAKDQTEYTYWFRGLNALREMILEKKSTDGLKGLTELKLPVPIKLGRRSSSELLRRAGLTVEDESEEMYRPPPLTPSSSKMQQPEIVTYFRSLNAKFEKLELLVHEEQYLTHNMHHQMESLLTRILTCLQRVELWMNDGRFDICEDELWRGSVEVESLENLIAALRLG